MRKVHKLSIFTTYVSFQIFHLSFRHRQDHISLSEVFLEQWDKFSAHLFQRLLFVCKKLWKRQSTAVGIKQLFVSGFKFAKVNFFTFKILLGIFFTILEHYLASPFSNIRKDIFLFINFFCFLTLTSFSCTFPLIPLFNVILTVFLFFTFRELRRYDLFWGLIRDIYFLVRTNPLNTLVWLGKAGNREND